MTPGRELDALVAEKVFGLKRRLVPANSLPNLDSPKASFPRQDSWLFLRSDGVEEYFLGGNCNDTYNTIERDLRYVVDDLPHYSTDIAAAWEVAQKIADDDNVEDFTIHLSPSSHRECEVEVQFWDYSNREDPILAGPFFLLGESAPHAICLAAMKAVSQ